MSENLEKFTPDQSKKTGKLTPEEIKEMVEKFKKEHKGLLPEYFSLPGEEKEEERELPEELLIYYEMKEKLKPIEKGLENKTLRENAIKRILFNIQEGQRGNPWSAWSVFVGYLSFLSYPEFNQIKAEYSEEINQIEKGLKDKTLREKTIKKILSDIQEGQRGNPWSAWSVFVNYLTLLSYPEFNQIKAEYPEEINLIEEGLKDKTLREKTIKKILSDIQKGQRGDTESAWEAFVGYLSFLSYPEFNQIKAEYSEEINQIEKGLKNKTLRETVIKRILSKIQEGQRGDTPSAKEAFADYFYLLSYLSHLYKVGQKKLREIESQKAMHPEKKKLPPLPEEKAF